jgi:hypothetical protein
MSVGATVRAVIAAASDAMDQLASRLRDALQLPERVKDPASSSFRTIRPPTAEGRSTAIDLTYTLQDDQRSGFFVLNVSR